MSASPLPFRRFRPDGRDQQLERFRQGALPWLARLTSSVMRSRSKLFCFGCVPLSAVPAARGTTGLIPLSGGRHAQVQNSWLHAADERTRQIEWEYIDVLNDVNRNVLDPLVRLPGMTAAEHRAALESAYEAESEELKRQLAEKHKLSVEELEELLDRMLKWKYEGASWSAD